MTEYEHKVYATGFSIEVDPPDRAVDVMHYLITGHLLCGRSLDGVTWKEVENQEYLKIAEKAARDLKASLRKQRDA